MLHLIEKIHFLTVNLYVIYGSGEVDSHHKWTWELSDLAILMQYQSDYKKRHYLVAACWLAGLAAQFLT